MANYRVWVAWTMTGYYEIEADTPEEAVDKAADIGDIPDGDYLEDSFDIDYVLDKDGNQVWVR